MTELTDEQLWGLWKFPNNLSWKQAVLAAMRAATAADRKLNAGEPVAFRIRQISSDRVGPWRYHSSGIAHFRDDEEIEALYAAQQPAIQPGHVAVPVEPTEKMVQATYLIDLSYMPTQWAADRAAVYRAMIESAQKEQK